MELKIFLKKVLFPRDLAGPSLGWYEKQKGELQTCGPWKPKNVFWKHAGTTLGDIWGEKK